MKYFTISEAVAVCDRVAQYLEENGYDAGYAEDLGIGLGEFTLYKRGNECRCMKFCSRFPSPIHFEAVIDNNDNVIAWEDWYDCAFTYGFVGGGQRTCSPEEWEQKIHEEVEKKK